MGELQERKTWKWSDDEWNVITLVYQVRAPTAERTITGIEKLACHPLVTDSYAGKGQIRKEVSKRLNWLVKYPVKKVK